MATANLEELDNMFDDNPSLTSLEDYHNDRGQSPFFGVPSHHSGFRSEPESEPESSAESQGPWAPPAWRKSASGWYRNQVSASSRETSPQYESAPEGDMLAANIPLPASPLKGSPRNSPERDTEGETPAPDDERSERDPSLPPADLPNYIRGSMRVEVLGSTAAFENAMRMCRDIYRAATQSWASTFMAFLFALIAWTMITNLFRQPAAGPVPDLVKVAGLARSFEPLIYYSENGVQQIGELQETGVAVWDLGESVRSTNMTSAPIIVKELDDLSDSLKTLSIELTKFFANVDSDVDGVLIVMDWAKRELSQVNLLSLSSFSAAFENLHGILCKIGILESSNGVPTIIGKMAKDLFGQTNGQRTRATLQRTFNEFLSVLEESINEELKYSVLLFGLFEAIDRQFLNLQRTVLRETDRQDADESELLSTLWARVIGANSVTLKKYERNRGLLKSIRGKTTQNKLILADHNQKLIQLKSNLEILRRKLVSPLVRSNESSHLSVEEQIRGLDDTYGYLREVRLRQKSKVMEALYGQGRRVSITKGEIDERGIEGR